MVLVDTSVWVDHLRRGQPKLIGLLEDGSVLTHPFVIGELACGNLSNRSEILENFASLPAAVSAGSDEVLALIESRRLWGRGIGWIDAHLLASALLSHCPLWTLDKQLKQVAAGAGVRAL